MPFLAKSIESNQHPAQHRVQRKALKALKRSGLEARLDDLTDQLTPYVAKEMCTDTTAARKQAKRWIVEAVAEMVAAGTYDVLFIGD